MANTRLDNAQRRWLRDLAKRTAVSLREELEGLAGVRVYPGNSLAVEATYTDGWGVEVARLSGPRSGTLELWFDNWPQANGRRVYFCYATPNLERARLIADAGSRLFGSAIVLRDDAYKAVASDRWALARPLPKRLYRRPITELYVKPGSGKFYGVYWPEPIASGAAPPRALVETITKFLSDLTRAAIGAPSTSDEAYPHVKNRAKVRRHLVRERSSKQATLRKVRDGYECQVCGIHFEALYGKLGHAFAEAHHRVPLASPKAKETITVEDLATVCANCHRMLHRMTGAWGDVERLRKIHTRRWPTRRPSHN